MGISRGGVDRAPEVLAVSSNAGLLDDVLRLAAAAGTTAAVAPDALAAVPAWGAAGMIVLDADALRDAFTLGLPRRPRVVVLVSGEAADDVWRLAVDAGVHSVVSLPAGEGWLVAAIAEAGGNRPSAAPILTVIGARGGAGASILAAAIARVATEEGLSAYLIDSDPGGCGLHVLLGTDELSGTGWQDLAAAVGRVPPRALREGLPSVAGIRLLSWRGPSSVPPPGVMGSILEAASRDGDVVVADLPRWLCLTDKAPGGPALEALTRSDQVVLVSTADVRAGLAARRLLDAPALQGLPVGLVVRGPSPGGLAARDLAEALGLPLLAAMASESRLDRVLEDGLPPGRRRSGPLLSTAWKLLHGAAKVSVR